MAEIENDIYLPLWTNGFVFASQFSIMTKNKAPLLDKIIWMQLQSIYFMPKRKKCMETCFRVIVDLDSYFFIFWRDMGSREPATCFQCHYYCPSFTIYIFLKCKKNKLKVFSSHTKLKQFGSDSPIKPKRIGTSSVWYSCQTPSTRVWHDSQT